MRFGSPGDGGRCADLRLFSVNQEMNREPPAAIFKSLVGSVLGLLLVMMALGMLVVATRSPSEQGGVVRSLAVLEAMRMGQGSARRSLEALRERGWASAAEAPISSTSGMRRWPVLARRSSCGASKRSSRSSGLPRH